MADVEKIEEALASLKAKFDSLSGQPPDYDEEFAAIREAVKPKSDTPKKDTAKKGGK